MKLLQEQWELFNKIMTLLERHLGPKCEVVLHDLTRDYSSTIVDIRHGHITNRKIGDSGSNLGLEVLRGATHNGDQFNYITYTRDNKILRSSSIYFRGENDQVIGALCVNLDITQSLQCEEYLHQFNQFPLDAAKKGADLPENGAGNTPPVKEVFVNSVQELLDYLIGEALAQTGKTVSRMLRADKLNFIRFLDQKGAFLVTRSGDVVCDFLGISKYTLYRYLDIVRGEREDTSRQTGEGEEPGSGDPS
ncbi:MAG: helix-turn-helix transcriptional regulator [Treponema sp.]|jgi:predicted transcriptional regulator YheO|nr:helix-turn-helix transcriptional regulator [Treponema sp.]